MQSEVFKEVEKYLAKQGADQEILDEVSRIIYKEFNAGDLNEELCLLDALSMRLGLLESYVRDCIHGEKLMMFTPSFKQSAEIIVQLQRLIREGNKAK